jgi:hypothetical protein
MSSDFEARRQRLRRQALPLSIFASALRACGVRNGELDLYRIGRKLQRELADAGALIDVARAKNAST